MWRTIFQTSAPVQIDQSIFDRPATGLVLRPLVFPRTIMFDKIDQCRERSVQNAFARVMIAGAQSIAPNLMQTTEPVHSPLKIRTAPPW